MLLYSSLTPLSVNLRQRLSVSSIFNQVSHGLQFSYHKAPEGELSFDWYLMVQWARVIEHKIVWSIIYMLWVYIPAGSELKACSPYIIWTDTKKILLVPYLVGEFWQWDNDVMSSFNVFSMRIVLSRGLFISIHNHLWNAKHHRITKT